MSDSVSGIWILCISIDKSENCIQSISNKVINTNTLAENPKKRPSTRMLSVQLNKGFRVQLVNQSAQQIHFAYPQKKMRLKHSMTITAARLLTLSFLFEKDRVAVDLKL